MSKELDLEVKEIKEAYDQVAHHMRGFFKGDFNLSDLPLLFKEVMEAVEIIGQRENYSGSEKKTIAHQMIDHFIDDLISHKSISESLGKNLKLAASLMSDTIFSMVALASKGGVAINNFIKKKCSDNCGGKCCIII